ncbi:MAG TPA: DUF3159 domain-containing protein [Actinopolymorphaceae bacterium]
MQAYEAEAAEGVSRTAPPESLARLLGGWRATTDATLPPVAFVIAWLVADRSIGWGAGIALAVSAGLTIYRLARGTPPRAVLLGLLGVSIAAAIVLYTGRAADFFLVQLVSNAGSGLAWITSIVVRWPLLGVVVGTALRQRGRWRRDPALLHAYSVASWPWVAQYSIRVVVFGILYAANAVVALAVARVALSWPLVALSVAASAWVMRRSLPDDHPGFRHPQEA